MSSERSTSTLIVVGYSVGALAWLSAASGLCDGVILPLRFPIRQYLHLAPLSGTGYYRAL